MNTGRPIDDDMLSAYLDGELPPQELRDVREALVSDPALVRRLAALQSVNELVIRHARSLDATPMPSAVLDLLERAEQRPTATVVQGPWQRWSRHAGAQLALAASLVLGVGFALNTLLDPVPGELPALPAYASVLDTSPSGTAVAVNDAMLTTRFTFRDNQGRYCRQYGLQNAAAGAENIACYTENGWNVVASIPNAAPADGPYQPASSSSELNVLLDALMQEPALDLSSEAVLMENGWQD